MPTPDVSVVTPARNAAATLAATLDSLRAQTFGGWEALVVDDGSTDATAAIVADFAAKDGRIVPIAGPGRGVSAARNVGLAAARGRRVLFLDADDWIAPDFLAAMLAALAEDPAAVAAYAGYERVMADGTRELYPADPEVMAGPVRRFARNCAVAIHAVLADRVAVLAIGGFDEDLRTCEDWDLWLRLAGTGRRWIAVDGVRSFYRTMPGSLSRNLAQMLTDAEYVIDRARRAFRDRDGAAGCADRVAAVALAYFALWCAVIARIEGSPLDTGTAFAALPDGPDTARMFAVTVIDAASIGLGAGRSTLAARWAEFGPQVLSLAAEMAARRADPVAGRRHQYAIERLVLDYSPMDVAHTLQHTLGTTFDLKSPTSFTPPGNVDRLYLHVRSGQRILSLCDIGALGTLGPRDVVRIAAECGEPPFRVSAGRGSSALTRALGVAVTAAARNPVLLRTRAGRRIVRDAAAREALLASYSPARCAGSHEAVLEDLQRRTDAELSPSPPGTVRSCDSRSTGGHRKRRAGKPQTVGASTDDGAHMPILMYHSVADAGPERLARYRVASAMFEEQIRWLRRHGYHAIASGQLEALLSVRRPFPERPVLLTFDDGYQDFADTAWPILRRHGFTAEVFLVSDLVGGAATWDGAGDAVALMDAQTIRRLAGEGAMFGSHLATHRAADGLATAELAGELMRSRRQIAAWTGTAPESLAAPYGVTDGRLRQLAAECGYTTVFSTVEGTVRPGTHLLHLPRIEVRGDWTLADFAAKMTAFPPISLDADGGAPAG